MGPVVMSAEPAQCVYLVAVEALTCFFPPVLLIWE